METIGYVSLISAIAAALGTVIGVLGTKLIEWKKLKTEALTTEEKQRIEEKKSERQQAWTELLQALEIERNLRRESQLREDALEKRVQLLERENSRLETMLEVKRGPRSAD